MGETKTRQLHIYCICGQKMKVTEEMFGRPGKCVQCRQKIWVPRAEQLPEGAQGIFLREHPEFLRKAPSHGRAGDEADAAKRGQAPASAKSREGLLPLDPLRPLQIVWSLDYRLRRRLSRASQQAGGEQEEDIETLERQLQEVKETRGRLEEALRERLTETEVELGAAEDRIEEAQRQAVAGELSWREYLEEADKLRVRREILERRRHNCRGWLAARDAHVAGGYLEVAMEDLPSPDFRLALPAEPTPKQPLHVYYLELLRDNLLIREETRRRLDEWAASGEESRRERERVSIRLERARAKAMVHFVRRALERLDAECAADLSVIEKQQEALRERKRKAGMLNSDYQAAVRRLQRAAEDLRGRRLQLAAGMRAETSAEAPDPDAAPRPRAGGERPRLLAGWEPRLTWLGALLIVLSLFLPAVGGKSLAASAGAASAQDPPLIVLVWGGAGVALAALGVSLLPGRGLRGSVLVLLWLVAAIGSLALLHEARYSLGPIGQRMRAEAWALQPGSLVGAAGLVSLAAASWLALAPLPGLRFAPLAALALLAGGAAVVLTDLAGLRKPAPVVTVQSGLQANLGPPLYECSVAVANAGRRSFVLGAPPSLPNGYGLKLERELTPGVWRETHLPDRIRAGGERLGSIAGGLPQIAVPPGGQVRLSYVLTPGSYRVLLDGRPVKAFTLEEPARSMVPAGPAPAEEADLPETPAGADEPLKEDGLGEEREGGAGQEAATEEEFPELPPAEAVVTAVVSVRDRPLVRVELHPEDQEAHVEKTVQLGDTVYGPWTFAEFDTAEQRVTLSDGERFLILRRSEPVELPGGRAPEED